MENDKSCEICKDVLLQGAEPIVFLTCAHSFHRYCIGECKRILARGESMLVCPTCEVGTEVASGDPEEQQILDLLALGPDSYGGQSSYSSEPETIVDDDEHGKGTAKGKATCSIKGNGNCKGKAAAPAAPPASGALAKRKACGFEGLEPPPRAKPKGGASGAVSSNVEPTQPAKAKGNDKGKATATSESCSVAAQPLACCLAAQPLQW